VNGKTRWRQCLLLKSDHGRTDECRRHRAGDVITVGVNNTTRRAYSALHRQGPLSFITDVIENPTCFSHSLSLCPLRFLPAFPHLCVSREIARRLQSNNCSLRDRDDTPACDCTTFLPLTYLLRLFYSSPSSQSFTFTVQRESLSFFSALQTQTPYCYSGCSILSSVFSFHLLAVIFARFSCV